MNRRAFLRTAALGGASAIVGVRPGAGFAQPPLETSRIRLSQAIAICTAPQLVAGELLRGEGFADVQYQDISRATTGALPEVASGAADIGITFSGPTIIQIDRGDPVVVLSGVHPGCFELFGTDRVRSLKDLKGKRIAVFGLGSSPHVFLSAMLAHVGLDPRKDVEWVTGPRAESVELLREGKVDAYMGFPPEPQELRARKIGHVVVNSSVDRPWSQYFCCMATGNREWVRKHPVATKRAVRAILKAGDLVAREPERTARFLVDRGFAQHYDYALQTLKEMKMAYTAWREYDPEDTLRFYALRLHEFGMIKSSPQKIIAQGTDWRFLKELKRELKQ